MRNNLNIRRRHRRSVPTLNTASLPDLIFTVLFFFMIVTHMRDNTVKVNYTTPEGVEVKPVTHKSAVVYVYVGTIERNNIINGNGNNEAEKFAIQVNDRVVSLEQVRDAVLEAKAAMSPEDQQMMVVSLHADKKIRMETITAIKQALREANVKRINYSVTEKVSD